MKKAINIGVVCLIALALRVNPNNFRAIHAFVVTSSPPLALLSYKTTGNGLKKFPRLINQSLNAAVRKVTGAELKIELKDWSTPAILDVYAEWCPPCQRLKPELENVAEKLGSSCRVLKLDSDEEKTAASVLKVVHREEGALPSEAILNIANKVFFTSLEETKND